MRINVWRGVFVLYFLCPFAIEIDASVLYTFSTDAIVRSIPPLCQTMHFSTDAVVYLFD